jgi:hypothetical protein
MYHCIYSTNILRPVPSQTDKTETRCFAKNPLKFWNIYENMSATCLCVLFLQPYRLPSPVTKGQNVSVLLPVSLPAERCQGSADMSLFVEYIDLINRDWCREE